MKHHDPPIRTTGSARQSVVTHNWMRATVSYDLARRLSDEQAFTCAFVDLRGYGLNQRYPAAIPPSRLPRT